MKSKFKSYKEPKVLLAVRLHCVRDFDEKSSFQRESNCALLSTAPRVQYKIISLNLIHESIKK